MAEEIKHPQVEIIPNGPMMVYGPINIAREGKEETLDKKTIAFCRCGASGNKPYCDGSHNRTGFEG